MSLKRIIFNIIITIGIVALVFYIITQGVGTFYYEDYENDYKVYQDTLAFSDYLFLMIGLVLDLMFVWIPSKNKYVSLFKILLLVVSILCVAPWGGMPSKYMNAERPSPTVVYVNLNYVYIISHIIIIAIYICYLLVTRKPNEKRMEKKRQKFAVFYEQKKNNELAKLKQKNEQLENISTVYQDKQDTVKEEVNEIDEDSINSNSLCEANAEAINIVESSNVMDTVVVLEENDLSNKGGVAFFIYGLKHAWGYLFKNFKGNYLKYYFYCVISFIGNLVPLKPYFVFSKYAILEKINNNENYEILKSFKKMNGIKTYLKFYIMSLFTILLALAIFITPVIIGMGPAMLFSNIMILGIIIMGMVSIFASVLVSIYTLSISPVYYLFSSYNFETIDYIKEAKKASTGKKLPLFVMLLLYGIVFGLSSLILLFIIGMFTGATATSIFLGLGLIIIVLFVPFMKLSVDLSFYQLMKTKVVKEEK